MRKLINTNQAECVGCSHCTRVCPIETANRTYRDESSLIKVKVDFDECIACGACIPACSHEARSYQDDTEEFFAALARGEDITVLTAPSIRSNFEDWRDVLGYIKGRGAGLLVDASLGADICTWAHVRHIQRNHPGPMIAQCCPCVVDYCTHHRPELRDYLSPIHSPLACAAIYLRGHKGVTGRIAAITPCIAKRMEFDETGLIDLNITYESLARYIAEHPGASAQAEHDLAGSGMGAILPSPGGLKEGIEYFLGPSVHILRSESPAVYRVLDEYAQVPDEEKPLLLDALSCSEGCYIGPGSMKNLNVFKSRGAAHRTLQDARSRDRASYETLHREYDERFDLRDFLRVYPESTARQAVVSEADMDQAFSLMGKDTEEMRRFNCGACGSNTCRDMARKIALGLNLPINCVVKARNDIALEHEKTLDYIEMVHKVGEDLFSAGGGRFPEPILRTLQTLCLRFDSCITTLWKVDREAAPTPRRILYWSGDPNPERFFLRGAWPECWIERLASGQPVFAQLDALHGMLTEEIESMLAVPVAIRGEFWGMLVFANTTLRPFSVEEISVIDSIGVLIVSSLLEHDMTEALIESREDALAGIRAKNAFLSRVSHELRTPMNAIIGMTDIARKNVTDAAKVEGCLTRISEASRQLVGIIDDVLDLSKIEGGRFELQPKPFELQGMIDRLLNTLAPRLAEKRLTLKKDLDASLPKILVLDEHRLAQVIAHLLDNAVKFTDEGGEISLRMALLRDAGGAHRLRVCVEDTGIGIAREQQEQLFLPFEQLDGSITRKYGGIGLGLTISKRVVEAMGGEIWVQSELKRGTIFTMEVPVDCPNADGITINPSESTAESRPREAEGDRQPADSPAAAEGIKHEAIDPELLDYEAGLRRFSGNEKAYQSLLAAFELEGKALMEQLISAIDREDREQILLLAHALFSAASNLAANELARCAEVIGKRARTKANLTRPKENLIKTAAETADTIKTLLRGK